MCEVSNLRERHPLFRGTGLALAWTAAALLLRGADWLAAWHLESSEGMLLGASAMGALLAAVPGFVHRRAWLAEMDDIKTCVVAFVCGMVMMLALGLAGSGRMMVALLEGSTGGYAFWGMALVAAVLTQGVQRRRKA